MNTLAERICRKYEPIKTIEDVEAKAERLFLICCLVMGVEVVGFGTVIAYFIK